MTDVQAVLITDMEGSTALTEGAGDAAAMETIRTHERLVRASLSDHGGREIKSLGDGFLLAFDEATDAVACALDIQRTLDAHNASHPEQPIHVRMGVNVGPVIHEGGDLYGTTVNATARIAAKARRGEVLVSEAVVDGVPAVDWAYVDRGLFWLKGLRERWRLYEATTDPSTTAGLALERGLDSGAFVGRDEERATLRAAMDAAMDGRGRVVLVVGEAGAGKTRLAEEVGRESAGRGALFLVGRSQEPGVAHPLAPVVEVLEAVERASTPETFRALIGSDAGEVARLLPHLHRVYGDLPPAAELPADQARRYLFASVIDVLARLAAPRPLYLLFDDVHWADEATAVFLEQLAEAVQTLPILVVATYIPSELTSGRALRGALEKLQRRALVDKLPMGPLRWSDVRALLASVGDAPPPDELVTLLHAETDGNAFFVVESIRYLTDTGRLFDAAGAWTSELVMSDVPETIRLSVDRRLERFAAETRAVLTTAAAIGRDFGFDILEALDPDDDETVVDALDDAERAGVIRSWTEGGLVRFGFAHGLIRQTLLAGVSPARRQILHARIADAMEAVHTASIEPVAAQIAFHLVEAGRRADPQRTVRFLSLAADAALRAAAYEEAGRHIRHALELLPPGDDAARATLLEKLAGTQRNLGRPDEALQVWDQAIGTFEGLGDAASVARVCLDAGMQVAWWRRQGDAMRLVQRALRVLDDRDDVHRAGLLALRANILGTRGRYEEAGAIFDEAVPMARRFGDERVLGTVLYLKASHHFGYIEHARAVEAGSESIGYLRRIGDLWNLTNALGFVGQSLGFLGRFDDAVDITEGAKDLATRIGNWTAFVYLDRARAWRPLSRRPDPDRLYADGARDLDLGERLGYDWMRAVGHARMSFASFLRGRWDDALAQARDAAACDSGHAHGHVGRLVLLHSYRGETQEALELYEGFRVAPPSADEPRTFGVWDSFLAAIEGLALLGIDEEVAKHHDLALAAIANGRLFRGWDYRLQHTLAGITATCGGRWDAAAHHLEEAVALADRLPLPLEQAESRRFFAWMLLRRRGATDTARARELLVAAREGYGTIGMPSHERLVEEMLSQA